MKKICIILTLLFSFLCTLAETSSPSYGVVTERNVEKALIEGEVYENVSIELKSAKINDLFVSGVKVIVKDSNGKKIYNKRFSNSYLYGFSDQSLQVRIGKAIYQVVIVKSPTTGNWIAEIREKGVE